MENNISVVGLIFVIFIVAIIGLNLISPLASNNQNAVNSVSDNGIKSILGLNTLMFILLFVGSIIGLSFLVMRISGFV